MGSAVDEGTRQHMTQPTSLLPECILPPELKDKGEGGGVCVCVGRLKQQLRENKACYIYHRPTVCLMSLLHNIWDDVEANYTRNIEPCLE